MNQVSRHAILVLAAAVIAACGKPSAGADDQPLAYAPADTPYAYANLEPASKPMLDWSQRQLQALMPELIGLYDRMLRQQTRLDERQTKILAAVLDEIRGRDTFDKLREIGYKPDARMALYGIGLIPVARIELADPAAFKAMITRVEAKVGEKIATGKTGGQEYWKFGDADGDIEVAIAVQGSHLVATLWTKDASEEARRELFGLKKPEKNLLDAGTLQAIAKKYNYSPHGEGYVDFTALARHLTGMAADIKSGVAKAANLPADLEVDSPACIAETQAIAQKFPRLVFGAEAYAPPQIRVSAELETEPALAQALMSALAAAPGTGTPTDALVDVSLATPLLKLKDFWIRQADAVAAKPFACAEFADINDSFAKSRQQLSATIPPPFSDLTGVRMTIDRLEPRKGSSVPEFAAKLLIGSNNPLAAIGMAQMAVPQLKDLQVKPDGKPVVLPAGLLPASAQLPPVSLAMTDKAIALAAGQGEDAALGAYFTAAPATTPVFLRMHFSGALYGLLGKYADTIQATMPADKKDEFAAQVKLFALYEKMIRSGEFTFEANANGIGVRETVDLGD